MAQKAKISLSIHPDLLRKLKRLAQIDRRSISSYVAKLIAEHIEGKGKKNENNHHRN